MDVAFFFPEAFFSPVLALVLVLGLALALALGLGLVLALTVVAVLAVIRVLAASERGCEQEDQREEPGQEVWPHERGTERLCHNRDCVGQGPTILAPVPRRIQRRGGCVLFVDALGGHEFPENLVALPFE